jgi:ABC-type bacteriocin/lantibiotic exporter with double-glycine peptidase domain
MNKIFASWSSESTIHEDDLQFEGGETKKGEDAKSPAKKVEEEKKELTPEEKAAKAQKDALAQAKARQLLKGYVGEHCCLFAFAMTMNIAGMIGEFVTPLFIGWVIDDIVKRKWDDVDTLVWQWMVFNAAGSIMQGLQRFLF